MDNRYCPLCGNKTLRLLEKCETGKEDEIKTSWTCDCSDNMVCIYEFTHERIWK